MIERRALARIEINQPAMIHFDGIDGVHGCVVKDVNDQGAKFHCPFYAFSRDFDLSLDGFKTTRRCHVVWRCGTTCGVRFVF
ncbi:PilZ domain-containing protein [Bradyrhizobium japonicum]|uniref:PilZ domain-containing protein n=1 Tax=Bradyrhizobium japonicum TaxID=375 RepID=UPI001BA91378|nr:PilZ domain-containing protein [Bradyrhizobium japonicum]MBR0916526.1 PilZ domain-containing protein [Bradyrhizobium japonicum]